MSVLLIGEGGGAAAADARALGELLGPVLDAELVRLRVIAKADRPDDEGLGSASALGSVEIRIGESPARALHELAEARGAAMIVLGSSHRAGAGRIFPGGVASRLLQGAPCPVAIAPRGFAEREWGEPRVIGVGFDGSEEAHEALALAATLGSAASAALRVITAYEGSPPTGNPVAEISPTPYEQVQADLRAAVEPLPPELRAEPRFRLGGPARVLIDESQLGLDLLVMGSRGYGPIRAVLLGSVSEVVVESAACPVIVVPRGIRSARIEPRS